MKTEYINDYDSFLVSNRKRVNTYLNKTMWYCILAGPAIAIGVVLGIYPDINYSTCIQISLVMLILSIVHFALIKKWPNSIWSSYFALLTLNCLLVQMSYNHVSIYLTWFLVPMLSILLCDARFYYFMLAQNYVLMLIATYITTPDHIYPHGQYDSFTKTFANRIGGFTIETFIMAVAGFSIYYLATHYFRNLIEKYKDIKKHETQIKEQLDILDSMSEIYDKVNLIDFEKMTERPLTSETKIEINLNLNFQDHTNMTRGMFESIVNDQLMDFIKFTDITTIQKRLVNRKFVTGEFIDKITGWFRAQYIVVGENEEGYPDKIIFTIQNIENEKRREEHLIRIAMTDELTRLYNRRSYEEDILDRKENGIEEDLAIFSIDVNGLKIANDTKGHAAGDELIKGAADCLAVSVGSSGKVYRTGGDEFVAIVHTRECEKLKASMKEKAASWHGIYSDKLSMSIGYASYIDNQDSDMEKLEKLADKMMYEDKDAYYKENGIDRRKR